MDTLRRAFGWIATLLSTWCITAGRGRCNELRFNQVIAGLTLDGCRWERLDHRASSLPLLRCGPVGFPDIYIAFSTLASLRTGPISHCVPVVLSGVIAFRDDLPLTRSNNNGPFYLPYLESRVFQPGARKNERGDTPSLKGKYIGPRSSCLEFSGRGQTERKRIYIPSQWVMANSVVVGKDEGSDEVWGEFDAKPKHFR